jgi:hypothetical protein
VAWIWQDGVMTDLNTLIPDASPYFLMEALSINDRSEIAGFMFDSSAVVAPGFVATPVQNGGNGTLPYKSAFGRGQPSFSLRIFESCFDNSWRSDITFPAS